MEQYLHHILKRRRPHFAGRFTLYFLSCPIHSCCCCFCVKEGLRASWSVTPEVGQFTHLGGEQLMYLLNTSAVCTAPAILLGAIPTFQSPCRFDDRLSFGFWRWADSRCSCHEWAKPSRAYQEAACRRPPRHRVSCGVASETRIHVKRGRPSRGGQGTKAALLLCGQRLSPRTAGALTTQLIPEFVTLKCPHIMSTSAICDAGFTITISKPYVQ